MTHRVLSWDEDEAIDRDAVIRVAQNHGDWNGQTVEFNDVGLVEFTATVTLPLREKIDELEHEIVALRKLALELQNTAIRYQDDIVRGLGE